MLAFQVNRVVLALLHLFVCYSVAVWSLAGCDRLGLDRFQKGSEAVTAEQEEEAKTAQVTVTVTGTLPTEAEVSTLSGDVFTPSKVIIAEGGSVTWTFGPVLHTVSFTSGAGAPSNITSGVSSSQSRTFNQAGNFSYICTIHAGMNGQVIVR